MSPHSRTSSSKSENLIKVESKLYSIVLASAKPNFGKTETLERKLKRKIPLGSFKLTNYIILILTDDYLLLL